MKFASISNGMYTNQYDSEVRITAFTAATASGATDEGKVKVFTTVFPVPAGQFQFSLDPILGKTRTINDIFNKRGLLGGSTTGEVNLTEKTTSVSLKTDYVFLAADKKGIEMSGNILEALIKGEGFIHDGAYQKVIGTNGTYKRGFNTKTGMFFGKILELDGRLVIADAATEEGNAITLANIRKTAYDKTCNYLIMEVVSKFDDDTGDGLRFVYTMNSDVQWSDATDANEISFTQTQLCDARITKNFFIEGYGENEYGVDVPARRVRFNKRPVSMFKAVLGEKNGASSGIDPTSTSVFTSADIDIPDKVVVANLAKEMFEEADYTPAANDIVSFYMPGDEAGTYKGGYGLAVLSTTTGATNTFTTVGASVSTDDSVVLSGDVASDVSEGDIVTIVDTTDSNEESVVLEVLDVTVSGDTTITFNREIGIDINDAVSIDFVDVEFVVVENDYQLSESEVYNDLAGSATSAVISETVTDILEYNFEETVFQRI